MAQEAAPECAVEPITSDDDNMSFRDICHAACAVLREPDPHAKAVLTARIVSEWKTGLLGPPAAGSPLPTPPDRPARSSEARTLPPVRRMQDSAFCNEIATMSLVRLWCADTMSALLMRLAEIRS